MSRKYVYIANPQSNYCETQVMRNGRYEPQNLMPVWGLSNQVM